MIKYTSGGVHYLLKIFQWRGSVFPQAFLVALPCAAITALLRYLISEQKLQFLEDEESVLNESQAWSGFSFLVGFLVVFRTSQAYSRFWDGCTAVHRMSAEWLDACSSLIAFTKVSKASEVDKNRFKSTITCLCSMLHSSALGAIEEGAQGKNIEEVNAFHYELLGAAHVDEGTLRAVRESDHKVELIFQWINQCIVENMEKGVMSIAPPILTRAFQEMASGMVAYHDAAKISHIPFPFPYAQSCDCLLVMHWCVVPFVNSQWVSSPFWAFLFTLAQVLILWSLNFIAVEIENPFGADENDLDGQCLQYDMNARLLQIVGQSAMETPTIMAKEFKLGPLITTEATNSLNGAWKMRGGRRMSTRVQSKHTGGQVGTIGSIPDPDVIKAGGTDEDPVERDEDSRSSHGCNTAPKLARRQESQGSLGCDSAPGQLERILNAAEIDVPGSVAEEDSAGNGLSSRGAASSGGSANLQFDTSPEVRQIRSSPKVGKGGSAKLQFDTRPEVLHICSSPQAGEGGTNEGSQPAGSAMKKEALAPDSSRREESAHGDAAAGGPPAPEGGEGVALFRNAGRNASIERISERSASDGCGQAAAAKAPEGARNLAVVPAPCTNTRSDQTAGGEPDKPVRGRGLDDSKKSTAASSSRGATPSGYPSVLRVGPPMRPACREDIPA